MMMEVLMAEKWAERKETGKVLSLVDKSAENLVHWKDMK